MDLKELDREFTDADLEWRVQTGGKKNDRLWALIVPYVTNRAIQERLDEVCGKANWRNEYYPGPHGGVMCGISIKIGDEWVTKYDGADNQGSNEGEAIKGGFSGSMKRAAVQWGMGRHLYTLSACFAKIHDNGRFRGQIKDGGKKVYFNYDPPTLAELKGEKPKPRQVTNGRQVISEGQRTELYTLASKNGWDSTESARIVNAFGIDSSKDIPQDKYDLISRIFERGPGDVPRVCEAIKAGEIENLLAESSALDELRESA